MERHLEESVLSKLPDNYQAMLKQSIISEENDMGTQSSLQVTSVCFILILILSPSFPSAFGILCMP
jgi:hypothetical protein